MERDLNPADIYKIFSPCRQWMRQTTGKKNLGQVNSTKTYFSSIPVGRRKKSFALNDSEEFHSSSSRFIKIQTVMFLARWQSSVSRD